MEYVLQAGGIVFQSTLLHEERHTSIKDVRVNDFNFNPRSYMRSD